MNDDRYRVLPSVTQVLESAAVAALATHLPRSLIVACIRQELDHQRSMLAQQSASVHDAEIIQAVCQRIEQVLRSGYRPVINATGIVLHTNLGRAPLAEPAAQAAYQAARGYLPLEFDLSSGERADRLAPIRPLVCTLTGAEAATAVNNCAAATLITLRVLAAGREVIVSRGQLIEIGGSYRLPDIMAASGAILREVGTTNKTRLSDYAQAIGASTAAILRVHCSNYRIRGFTESVPIAELAALGRQHHLPVIDDIGSGAVEAFEDEPTIREGLAAGADLVLFSGDKLLGGPQAGLIAGRKRWIEAIERDPFMRALRLDKMTLAALEATLRLHLDARPEAAAVPVLRLLHTPLAELQQRADQFADVLRTIPRLAVEVRPDSCFAGGGSLPDQPLPTVVIALACHGLSETELARRLRTGEPPVVPRIQAGRVLLDLRTVWPDQQDSLLAAIRMAVG